VITGDAHARRDHGNVRAIKGAIKKGNRAMKKLLAVATLAFAFAAQTAAACDWNREASSQEEQTVATTATPSEPTQVMQQAAPSQPVATTASDQTARQPAEPSAPVVLVNDRH